MVLAHSLSIWEKAHGPESEKVARCLMDFAIHYAYQNEVSTADSLYQKSIDIYGKVEKLDQSGVVYLQACYFTVSGNREKALQYLERSIELGFGRSFYKDPLMASLQGDPEFEEISENFR